jgi:hypothetical protein
LKWTLTPLRVTGKIEQDICLEISFVKRGMTAPIAILTLARISSGSELPPYYYQCRLVDRVSKAGKLDPILESLAEGRMETAPSELETRVGLPAGQLRGPDFKAPTVRAHALRTIGRNSGAQNYPSARMAVEGIDLP